MYVKILGEEDDKLIGISAQQLKDLQEGGESEQEIDDLIQANKFKQFNFTLRSKIDSYQSPSQEYDQQKRVVHHLVRNGAHNFKLDNESMLHKLKLYSEKEVY